MHLFLKDINLTVSKLVLLDSIAHSLLLLLFEYQCHLLCSDTSSPTLFFGLSHLLFLLVIQLALCLHLFGLLIIPLRVDLPLNLLVILLNDSLQGILVREWNKRMRFDYHHDPFQLPRPDEGPQKGLALTEHVKKVVCIPTYVENLFRGTETHSQILLDLRIDRGEMLHEVLSHLGLKVEKLPI